MRTILSLLLVSAFAGLLPAQSFSDKISPELRAALQSGQHPDVIVVFAQQAGLKAAKTMQTKSEKAHYVFSSLQQTAAAAQKRALHILRSENAAANSLFLVNALAIPNASAALLGRLAELPEVSAIAMDPWVKFDGPVAFSESLDAAASRDQVEWGVAKIQAPEVWALGYTGQGITVGGSDTGYDWLHPAIQPHYRGWTNLAGTHDFNWHDAIHELNPLNNDTLGNPGTNPCGLDSPVPCDDSNHGTHTMGTMTGDDGNGNQIGVAPGAQWIGCRNMERGWGRPSSYLECFQWFLAPTDLGGTNPDPDKAPHVINNSWYCAYEEGCNDASINELFRLAVDNLKASGVVVVVANGNFGPNCGTTVATPAIHEESFCVGATRDDDFIAQFSSRGPVVIDSSMRIKPNVSAPGVNVRSSVRDGQYANSSGTSMAGPHVTGLVALMLSANPALAGHVEDIEDIVEKTSVFLADTLDCGAVAGTARPNHAYGWGRVNALAAVQEALLWEPLVGAEEPALPSVSVQPNPVRETLWMQLKDFRGATECSILNAAGQEVSAQRWDLNGAALIPVQMTGMAPGVYFWQLRNGKTVMSGKFVKI